MANAKKSAEFFVVGGTLERAAASYVRRSADDDLLRGTLAGEYCNVLAARQTGKSSLMVRTAERLKKQGVKPVIIDLTSIGSQVTASEWYFGLISYLTRQLNMTVDAQFWWNARKEISPVQRFSDFLHEVILDEIHEPIVIFIDEIDSTLKLEFTDDFFAAIRAAYNARSQNADLKRLTFVLLGVARPVDLIKDRTRTAYNIGIGIDITDFLIEELGLFEKVLEKAYPGQGRQILEWVLEWTGGQPYLTQKLCYAVVEQGNGLISEDRLDHLVERLFLGDMARTETNLRSIRDQMKKNPHLAKMLRIYRRVLANKQVKADEQSIEQNELKLTGLVKTTPQGTLQARNRIYAHIFDKNWVKENMQISAAQRWAIVATVIAAGSLVAAGYFYYEQQNQNPEIQARTYVDNFNNSNSQEVKITSLAGLFKLGNEYATEALTLFDALGPEKQLALFDLTSPVNVGDELVVVVGEVYQTVENNSEGDTLLKAMADALEQTSATGATSLALEINNWLDARRSAADGEYPLAISLYTRAFDYSKDRKNENASILIERASIFTNLNQYDKALADYDIAVEIDRGRGTKILNTIAESKKLADYWREHPLPYLHLSNFASSVLQAKSSIAYHVPKTIKLNETVVIELFMNPSLSQKELSAQLVESTLSPLVIEQPAVDSIVTSEIFITPLMKADLISENRDAIDIQPMHDNPDQIISSTDTTKWNWLVNAKKPGTQTLILVIARSVEADNNNYWHILETERINIEVRATGPQLVAAIDWKWLTGILATALLALLFLQWYRKRK